MTYTEYVHLCIHNVWHTSLTGIQTLNRSVWIIALSPLYSKGTDNDLLEVFIMCGSSL